MRNKRRLLKAARGWRWRTADYPFDGSMPGDVELLPFRPPHAKKPERYKRGWLHEPWRLGWVDPFGDGQAWLQEQRSNVEIYFFEERLIDEQVRAAEEHEAALADAISTHCAGTVGGIDDEDINVDDLIDEQVRAAEEHEAEEALALADAISTHCADGTFKRRKRKRRAAAPRPFRQGYDMLLEVSSSSNIGKNGVPIL